ncbi:MAG: DUF167 family protein [Dehalococcoidia bacterium]|nr:DUF167 family protein [Dehalococcoidia bacterium]
MERLLAKALGVPRSAVRVVSGERAREKIVAVADLGTDDALARLRAAAER